MVRFYFHIHDGTYFPDDEGTELPDIEAAQRRAVSIAGDLLRDCKGEFWNGDEWQLEVWNDTGRKLFTLRFHAIVFSAE